MDNEGEKIQSESIGDEKLDPYFSDDFDLDSLSYSDLEDLLNSVYDELNKVQDSRKERILEKNARRLESLLDDGGNSGEGFQFESIGDDDVLRTTIKVSPYDCKWINKALNSTPDEMKKPKQEIVWRTRGRFPDGKVCEINLQTLNDMFYLDGVLIVDDYGTERDNPKNQEKDSVLGDWVFEDDGIKYICTIEMR